MNDFQPGTPGGGNLGFAVGAFTEFTLCVAQQDGVSLGNFEWSDERRLLVTHVLDEWRKRTKTTERYWVVVEAINTAHTGFASSAAIQIAVWCALNFLYGNLFSDSEIRKLMADTYREVEGDRLTKGFTTGLASFLGLYGGFAVVNNDLTAHFHSRVPEWTSAIVIPRDTETISFGQVELDTLTSIGPQLDQEHRAEKLHIINNFLVPAVIDNDLIGVGKAVAGLQRIGSKVAEIAIYGSGVAVPMEKLRSIFPCVYMSAIGPGLAVLSDSSESRVLNELNRLDFRILWIGKVDNIGLRIRTHAYRRPV